MVLMSLSSFLSSVFSLSGKGKPAQEIVAKVV